MKNNIHILLIVLFLSSCSPSGSDIPTLQPSLTPLPEPTRVPTQTIIPTSTSTPRPAAPAEAFNIHIEFSGLMDPDGHGGPDASIAAGPDVLVLAMNSSVGIMDKKGKLIDQRSMAVFFSPLKVDGVGGGTDPRVLYDIHSQRFFLVKADYPECEPELCGLITLAVSKTTSPQSLTANDWYYYAFNRSQLKTPGGITFTGYHGDFDNISFTDDTLAISWDQDSSILGWLGPGGQIRFMEKAPLLEGKYPEIWMDKEGLSGHVAINLDDPGYFFVVDSLPTDFRIWSVENGLINPGVISRRPLSFDASFNDPPDALQSDGPEIDILEGKNPGIYINDNLWLAFTIKRNFGSGPVSAIHWMQIDVSDWPETKIVQSGILGEDGVSYFGPTHMVDENGNFMLVYARSSQNEFISTHYTGRLATDPLGVLRPSNVLTEGRVGYSRIQNQRNRYMDFFGSSLDPVDGSIWLMVIYPCGGECSATWVANFDWSVSSP
jgi:hypothetical protein